jgi:2-C-methyl-D-erythritol 2,4-cyclodiphosphate synthase
MLLKQVLSIIQSHGWQIGNIDSTIVAEQPKLKPHLKSMRSTLAEALALDLEQVSIKATTNERLGPVGREEGICAYAVVLLNNSTKIKVK